MNYIDQLAADIYALTAAGLWEMEEAQALYRSYAVLALVRGMDVTNRDVHDAWAAWCAGTDPRHRSLVPFSELSPEVQALDTPYTLAIRQVAAGLPQRVPV